MGGEGGFWPSWLGGLKWGKPARPFSTGLREGESGRSEVGRGAIVSEPEKIPGARVRVETLGSGGDG